MSRWSKQAVLCAVVLESLVAFGPSAAARTPPPGSAADPEAVHAGALDSAPAPEEALDSYLEAHSLKRLLAEHLAGRIATVRGPRRVEIAERLGEIYVDLLGAAKTDAERQLWQSRAEELLRQVPDADTFSLRINLAKAVYQRAEETAERFRLRLASAEEAADAQRALESLKAQLTEIAARTNRRVEALERAEDRGLSDAETPTDRRGRSLEELLAEARRLRSLAFYYSGWCNYYLAFLTGRDKFAADGLESFGWLLNSGKGRSASVERLPEGLLKYEHIARAAIGSGLCAAARGNDTEAIRWLDAVEKTEEVPDAVRSQLLSRRFVVLAGASRWADVERLVRLTRKSDRQGGGPNVEPLKPGEARLLAVLALDGSTSRRPGSEGATALARTALADLVTRGEVSHVLDLVSRYGTATLGDTGFVVRYVRAMAEYEKTRAQHRELGATRAFDADSPVPASETELINRYRAAGALLEQAVREADAPLFPAEAARTGILLGMAEYYAGDLLKAADRFLASSRIPAGADARTRAGAEEALWLAILALEKAAERNRAAASIHARAREAAVHFISEFPDSPRAARLILRDPSASLVDPRIALDILMGVSRDSGAYEPARRQAARLLYVFFRAGRGAERDFAAARFLAVADETLGMDKKAALEGEGEEARLAAERVVARVRQMLDALLGASAPDPTRAEAVLEVLRGVAAYHAMDLAQYDEELLFRRLQIALARADDAAAESLLTRMRAASGRTAGAGGSSPAAPGQFVIAAERTLFKMAVERWRRDRDAEGAASRVVALGRRVVDGLGPESTALRDPAAVTVYATVAEAALQAWESGARADRALLDLAIRLDGAILSREPGAEASLARLGPASEAAGDTARALECWRLLLAGRVQGEPGWFEARYHSIRLLALADPALARQAIDQHKVLHPELGPEPWRALIGQLDRELPPSPAAQGSRTP